MRANLSTIRGDSRTFAGLELGGFPDEDGLYDAAQVTFTAGSLFTKTLDDGIDVEDDSHITLTLEPGDTDGAPAVRVAYPFDVQMEHADGRVATVLRGLFVVLPDVTTGQ